MNKFTDTLYLLKETFAKTLDLIRAVPVVLAVPVVHVVAYFGLINLGLTRFGMFSGLLTTLALALILSSFLYVLRQALFYRRFQIKDLYAGVRTLFLRTWFFLIVANLVNYLVAMTGALTMLGIPGTLVTFMLFNPMPEIIYISEYSERDMFYYNFNFIRRNYLPWYSLNLLLLVGLFALLFVSSLILYIANMLLVVYLAFAMLFRGVLFKRLHQSNPRKRQFQRYNR